MTEENKILSDVKNCTFFNDNKKDWCMAYKEPCSGFPFCIYRTLLEARKEIKSLRNEVIDRSGECLGLRLQISTLKMRLGE